MVSNSSLRLANPSCTQKPNDWLPHHKDVAPTRKRYKLRNHQDFIRVERKNNISRCFKKGISKALQEVSLSQ